MAEWRRIKFKEVLKQYRNTHWVEDKNYRQVTISQTGEVSYRGTKHGSQIGRKRQFIIDLKTHPNTLIFIRQGVFNGGIGICPKEVDGCLVTENMPMFDIVNINPEYLIYYLKSPQFKREVDKLVPLGTAQKAVHERQLLEIEIPLPSKDIQEKIIKQLNNNSKNIFELNSINNKNENYIVRLRQQILQEAVQGKLVKQDPKDEPAAELLKKIKAEKDKLIKEGKIRKEKPLPVISQDEIPFDLPKSWVWCRLGILSSPENYSFVDGPFGSNLKREHYVEKGVRIIQLQNIGEGFWKEGKNVYTSEKKAEELIRCNAYPGDLVIAKMAPVARATIIPDLHKKYVLCSDCVRFKPHKSININYIKYLLNSEIIRNIVILDSTGMTRQRTSLGKLKMLTIPLPPLFEQKRIVEKVDKLMAYCDVLEKQVQENQGNSEKLMVAVLKESFKNG